MESFGYIETLGYVAAIVAADAALKAADVRLTNCYFVKGGRVTVEITGDVAAVKSGVEAGSECAKQLGNFISSNVIARIATDTKKILVDERITEEVIEEIIEQIEEQTTVEQVIEEQVIEEDIKKEHEKNLRKKLLDAKVIELKQRVHNLKLGYSWEQIKGMKKKKLIDIIIKNNQEE